MNVRNATLVEVRGSRAGGPGYQFVPAAVGFPPGMGHFESPLLAHTAGLARFWPQGGDAAWVRARLPRVFGVVPADPEDLGEKSLMCETLLAVRGGAAWAFEVSDVYGAASLVWRGPAELTEPPEAVRAAIAHDLWELLLSAPTDLADFEARVPHLGAPVTLVFACRGGVVTLDGESD